MKFREFMTLQLFAEDEELGRKAMDPAQMAKEHKAMRESRELPLIRLRTF